MKLKNTTNQTDAIALLIQTGFTEISSYFVDNIYEKDGKLYKIAHPVWNLKDVNLIEIKN